MMPLHLDEISSNVAKGAHAVVPLDRGPGGSSPAQARHARKHLPPIFLPSRAPELNPVENVWQYLRQNWIPQTPSSKITTPLSTTPPSDAWRKLTAQPETITSIGMRDWAHVGQSL